MASAMTAATGAAAGTTPPAPVIQADGRDDTALIWLGTGTGTTAAFATLATITLGGNYSSYPDAGAVPKILVSFMLGGMTSTQIAGVIAAGLVYSVTTRTIIISASSTSNALPASIPASASGIGVVIHMDS